MHGRYWTRVIISVPKSANPDEAYEVFDPNDDDIVTF